MYIFYSELKHLINYRKGNKKDAVSSGERMRQIGERGATNA